MTDERPMSDRALFVQPDLFGQTEMEVRVTTPSMVTCPHCSGHGVVPYIEVPSAPARPTDPHTSQDAADRLRSDDVGRFSWRSRQAKLLRAFHERSMTDQEAALSVSPNANPSAFDGCRRRCSDLRAAGYLIDSGERRANAGSPDLSVVWTVSLAGEVAYRNLDVSGWSRGRGKASS